MQKLSLALFAALLAIPSLVFAEVRGRVDVGAVYAAVDILESGKTVKTLHMEGIKGDATILPIHGFAVKPSFIWTTGHGDLAAATIAVGYYIPIVKCFSILPNIGITWSYLKTTLNLEELGVPREALPPHLHDVADSFHVKERFRSDSPFLGLDFSLTIFEKLTLIGMYQYAWARTHTKITGFGSDKSHSCGPNYSLALDYSLNQNWSISLGAGYNITLSKEKHGLRGKGVKLGLAYYF